MTRLRTDSHGLGRRKNVLLTRKELAGFRGMLREKRRAMVGNLNGLEAEMRRSAHGDVDVVHSNLADHLADFGTDCQEREVTAGLLATECGMLNEIDEALDRIDGGTYGICLACGEPIARPRLLARPWARCCIKCARMLERDEDLWRNSAVNAGEGARIAAGSPDELDDPDHQPVRGRRRI